MTPRILRGSTFEGALTFTDPDDEAKWAALRPDLNEVRAVVRIGNEEFQAVTEVRAVQRQILFSLDTTELPLGRALFNIWVIGNGRKIPHPNGASVAFELTEGAGP